MAYNNELILQDAQREKVALKLCLSAVTGGGKTFGGLLIAFGMMKEKYPDLTDEQVWSKVVVLDTENGSGSLYVNYNKDGIKIGRYKTIKVSPPFTPARYIRAIEMCEEAGIEVLIVDSFSHAWSGEGGILDKQADASKKAGVNSYTAWRDVTPLHNKLVNKILQTDIHIISTLRTKMEHAIEKDDNGKTIVRKIGLSSVQRDGMEYEFTMVFDIDNSHNSFGSKDRSGIFDQRSFRIDMETGRTIMRWLNEGEVEVEHGDNTMPQEMLEFIVSEYKKAENELKEKIKGVINDYGIKSLTDASLVDIDALTLAYKEVKGAI